MCSLNLDKVVTTRATFHIHVARINHGLWKIIVHPNNNNVVLWSPHHNHMTSCTLWRFLFDADWVHKTSPVTWEYFLDKMVSWFTTSVRYPSSNITREYVDGFRGSDFCTGKVEETILGSRYSLTVRLYLICIESLQSLSKNGTCKID